MVDKNRLGFVEQNTDILVESLLLRWRLEGELATAPATKLKLLQKQRDEAEEQYNEALDETKEMLNKICEGNQGIVDEVLKRIGNLAYKQASQKFL